MHTSSLSFLIFCSGNFALTETRAHRCHVRMVSQVDSICLLCSERYFYFLDAVRKIGQNMITWLGRQ